MFIFKISYEFVLNWFTVGYTKHLHNILLHIFDQFRHLGLTSEKAGKLDWDLLTKFQKSVKNDRFSFPRRPRVFNFQKRQLADIMSEMRSRHSLPRLIRFFETAISIILESVPKKVASREHFCGASGRCV